MNLFEKIDMFEKMATQLVGDDTNDGSETADNIENLEASEKNSIRVRADLLKTILKKRS